MFLWYWQFCQKCIFLQVSIYNQFIKLFIYDLLLPFTLAGIIDLYINLPSSVKKNIYICVISFNMPIYYSKIDYNYFFIDVKEQTEFSMYIT